MNNGGAYEGLPEGQHAATIVRLATGITGVVPETQAVPEPSTIWLACSGAAVVLLLHNFVLAMSNNYQESNKTARLRIVPGSFVRQTK